MGWRCHREAAIRSVDLCSVKPEEHDVVPNIQPEQPDQSRPERRPTRRRVLSTAAATTLIVGFDSVSHSWVPAAEASGARFDRLPRLDGTLHIDPTTRAASSTDNGNIHQVTPRAVLRPGSTSDVAKVIRYCRPRGIKVAARGQAHTTHGQGLTPGLVIENRSRRTIHSISPDSAVVDSGVLWTELINASWEHGLTPPTITGYTNLSIGGVLSVGGVPGTNRLGGLVDNVTALEVVTGDGRVHQCSMSHKRELFEVALAGLGQCGVITQATVRLIQAPQMARWHQVPYTDNATFFQDMRTLLERGELDEVYCMWIPSGTTFVYMLQAVKYYDVDAPPDSLHLLRGLSVPAEVAATDGLDLPYRDFALRVNAVVDNYPDYEHLVKPWFDVWLPESTVEAYIDDVIPTLTPLDVGASGFLLLFPQRRSALTRPFFVLPESDDWIYLFDILTSSAARIPEPDFTERMMDRNHHLFDQAREAGGTRYPIGSLDFRRSDWRRHYGAHWRQLAARKRRYDPDNILTPGPGIFPG